MDYNLDQMFGVSTVLQLLGPAAIVIAIVWATNTICAAIRDKW
jgi:hypothetical protein